MVSPLARLVPVSAGHSSSARTEHPSLASPSEHHAGGNDRTSLLHGRNRSVRVRGTEQIQGVVAIVDEEHASATRSDG